LSSFPNPCKEIPDKELLLPYELKIMSGDWRNYLKTKRQCWLASIQMFPDLWESFVSLDKFLQREFADLHLNPQPQKAGALLLFLKAHQGIRVAAEIAFSTHISQAYDLARSAIDVAAM
jgi:hypothetical protein